MKYFLACVLGEESCSVFDIYFTRTSMVATFEFLLYKKITLMIFRHLSLLLAPLIPLI